MAKIKLTENQRIAVEDKSGTLLVAAAAGSGKTAILTKRLIDRLCAPDGDGDISQYLVVTFTKAATSELRERLYKALSEYVRENPKNSRARRQLSLIGLAKISTIHSFCLDIIKSNFEALSLPSTLRMGEETEINVLLRTTLEAIIAERYEDTENNTMFLKAVEVLSSAKNDEKFISAILDLYKKLRGLSEPEKRFNLYLERYLEVISANEIFDTYFGKLIRNDLEYELGRAICELECILADIGSDEGVYEVLSEALEKDIAALKDICSTLPGGYVAVKALSESFSATRAKSSKNCENIEFLENAKEQRSKCHTKLKAVMKHYLSASPETVRIAAEECHALLSEIYALIFELDRKFSEEKLEAGLLDYADLEQYALRLLVEDTGEFGGKFRRTALAESISKNYCEIYVDEYQDTNSVQDMIFRAVSTYDENTGTETNRFLVGDVKQSIYRFRGAQPEIFSSYIKKFEDVREENAKNSTTHKIYLSNNFRCSENVIDTVNLVFDSIMADYTADDRLIYSKHEENKITAPCELALLYPAENGEDEKESSEKLSEEALYIAARIREMAFNPNVLRENGEMYKYSDFAVLARSANSLSDEYRRAFRKMGVPFTSDTPEDFFALPEVLLAMCLFNCVDNPMRDIYTAGIMYSPVFRFTADELCEIRSVGRKLPFYSAVKKYAEESENAELCEKAGDFLEKIDRFRQLSRGTPTDVLISIMFDETGLPDIYSDKEAHKRKNIEKLYELARGFEKTSFRGLSAFLDYLGNLSEGKTDSRPESERDSVRFMSIHRSKGLEFPIVFLTGAAKQFNSTDEKEPVIFSASRGIGIKLRDTADTRVTETRRNFAAINTLFREAIRSHERTDMLEEEKRLLYVAMTRARDRLIMTALTKDSERELALADIKRRGGFRTYGKYAMRYFDFIYHALTDRQFSSLSKKRSEVPMESPLICYSEQVSQSALLKASKSKSEATEAEAIDQEKKSEILKKLKEAKAASPYISPLSKISAKLSVSQLKKGLLDEEENAKMKVQLKKVPNFMLEKSEADAAEKGTAAHIFMQFADYESLEKSGAAHEADRLLSLGFITERMREIMDLSVLDAFVKSELYAKIKESTRQYRERRFNLRLPASEFTDDTDAKLDDAYILVQGVSDLYFENPDGSFTLVDFKTDRVKENDGADILKRRHSAQLTYYKRAIEEITGGTVKEVYIYSFALGREILLDI